MIIHSANLNRASTSSLSCSLLFSSSYLPFLSQAYGTIILCLLLAPCKKTDLSCHYFDENTAYRPHPLETYDNVMSANAVFLVLVCSNLVLLNCI